MTTYIDGVRAALNEMAQKKEGADAVAEAKEITYRVGDKKQHGNMGAKNLKDLMAKLKAAKFDMKSLEIYDKDARKQIMQKGKMVEATEEGNVKEAMDPVDKKELKKDFKDRSDKDVDNDGDVDKSDEYLVKKRKAISKTVKKNEDEPEGETGETATMNPKKEDKATKESTFRDRLMSIWEDAAGENRKKDQNKEPISRDDERSGKKMRDGHPAEKKGEETPAGDESKKAETSGPTADKSRGNDNMQGDKAIINKIAAAYKGMK